MRRILHLIALLSTLCLTVYAQPSRDDIIRSQHVVLERLAERTFIKSTVIPERDKNGKLLPPRASVSRYVMRDDETLYTPRKVEATVKLWGVTLMRQDGVARFLPVFVTTASVVKYERREGALYVMRVGRLNGIQGFEGRVWVTGGGFVARAEGRYIPKGLKANEKPLRYLYVAQARTYLPSAVVVDDEVGGRRVRVEESFYGYGKFEASSRVVEEGP